MFLAFFLHRETSMCSKSKLEMPIALASFCSLSSRYRISMEHMRSTVFTWMPASREGPPSCQSIGTQRKGVIILLPIFQTFVMGKLILTNNIKPNKYQSWVIEYTS